MQSYISHRRGRVFNPLIFFFFFVIILLYWFVTKNIGNYRKYDIFFNFRFTENMIFPSNAENHENMIFTFSVFTKMLFFMQWFKSSFKINKVNSFTALTVPFPFIFLPNFFITLEVKLLTSLGKLPLAKGIAMIVSPLFPKLPNQEPKLLFLILLDFLYHILISNFNLVSLIFSKIVKTKMDSLATTASSQFFNFPTNSIC